MLAALAQYSISAIFCEQSSQVQGGKKRPGNQEGHLISCTSLIHELIHPLPGYDAEEIPEAMGNGVGKDFLESPMMTDGTIEEDFEEALAKEVAIAGALGSPETPQVSSKIFEGWHRFL